MSKVVCEYGCGREAKHQFRNKKWCCESHHSKCPKIKRKTLHKIPWNKGKVGIYKKETIEKMKYSMKGRPGYWTGKKRDKKTIEKIKLNHANFYGQKNPNWKGGYSQRNIPTYDSFFDKLTIEENPKKYQKDQTVLTVLCTHCKKRFIPSLKAVRERVRALNGKQHGEQRLYCSTECKYNCSIFNKHTVPQDHPKREKKYTQKEYDIWRKEVLNRSNYECEYCGRKAIISHHSQPQKLEPIFVLDPDYGIACCEECHYKYGHKAETECSTGNLANKICNTSK